MAGCRVRAPSPPFPLWCTTVSLRAGGEQSRCVCTHARAGARTSAKLGARRIMSSKTASATSRVAGLCMRLTPRTMSSLMSGSGLRVCMCGEDRHTPGTGQEVDGSARPSTRVARSTASGASKRPHPGGCGCSASQVVEHARPQCPCCEASLAHEERPHGLVGEVRQLGVAQARGQIRHHHVIARLHCERASKRMAGPRQQWS